MNHAFISKIWAYDPASGEVSRNGKPVRHLNYPQKIADCGYRCQVNHEGMNYSYKAEHVAWCLLTGKDLAKHDKVLHINGNKRDNRALNLCLSSLVARPGKTHTRVFTLPDGSETTNPHQIFFL